MLDLHCEMILEEYRAALPDFERMKEEVLSLLHQALKRNGMEVTAVEARIKTEESLRGKLSLKGHKYATLSDITDIVGARVVTFYTDDVDRIAAMTEQLFEIDWENSVDKRNSAITRCITFANCRATTIALSYNCAPRCSTLGRRSITTRATSPALRYRANICVR